MEIYFNLVTKVLFPWQPKIINLTMLYKSSGWYIILLYPIYSYLICYKDSNYNLMAVNIPMEPMVEN